MSDTVLKNSLILLAILLVLVLIWQPVSKLFSPSAIVNEFVLETVDGPLDSRKLRGRVLAVSLAYTRCGDPCAERLSRTAKGYEILDPRDRALVSMIVVSVDPERDTAADIAQYARRFHPEMTGATGKPEVLAALAEGFSASYRKLPTGPDGSYRVDHSHAMYLVDTQGRFASALHERATPEEIARALRAKLPAPQPPA
jgi:protein SCO1/2